MICPQCHGSGSIPDEHLLDAAELLAILTTATPKRDVYRAAKSKRWFVTYGGGETSEDAVRQLVLEGKIRDKWNRPNGNDYFSIPADDAQEER